MHPSMLYNIVYASSAAFLYSEENLQQILASSRANNSKEGITGMLLYVEGNIMQVLEGEKNKVLTLYEKIKRDPRHRNVFVLTQGYIDTRNFGKWSMGFHRMEKTAWPQLMTPEVFDLRTDHSPIETKPPQNTPALILMKSFYDSMVKRNVPIL